MSEQTHVWGQLSEYTAGWARECACGAMWWEGRDEPKADARSLEPCDQQPCACGDPECWGAQ